MTAAQVASSPIFFETSIPMYPEGAGRCRRVAVAYAEGLPRAMARLEARRKELEAFLRKREHGLETPWALSAELVESSIEATRRIEADLKARMNRTGKSARLCLWVGLGLTHHSNTLMSIYL